MKIEKTPSGKYRVRKTVNKKAYIVTFDHKPGKKEAEQAILDKINEAPAYKSDTFESFASDFLEIQQSILKPSTLRSYHTVLKGLSEEFRALPISTITNADIQREIGHKAMEASPKTCMNYKGFIGSVMSMYRPEFHMNVKTPARAPYQKYVPTTEEVQAVLAECNPQMYIAFRVLLYGLRRGEMAALTIDDLSDQDMLTINKAYSQGQDNKWHLMDTPKTAYSNRTIKIDHELAELIRKQGYIYKGSIDYPYEYLQRIQIRLGQHHWRLHDFRAYMATEVNDKFGEATALAVGGWGNPSIFKSTYRKSRYSQNEEIQTGVSEILYQPCIAKVEIDENS